MSVNPAAKINQLHNCGWATIACKHVMQTPVSWSYATLENSANYCLMKARETEMQLPQSQNKILNCCPQHQWAVLPVSMEHEL